MELFKRDNSKFWWVSFFVDTVEGNRERIRKSTKTEKKREAEKMGWSIIESYKAEKGAGTEKSQAFLEIVRKATDLATKGDLGAYQAQQFISDILEISTGEGIQSYTVREWFNLWLEGRKEQVKLSTYRFYKGGVNAFLSYLDDIADNKLHTLTKKHILEYRANLKESGIVSKTVNHKIKAVNSCLEQAKKENLIPLNPCYGVEKLPEDDSKSRIPFTTEEVTELLKHAPTEDWQGAILTAITTGLRLLDITNLHWGQVDLQKALITIKPRKTSRKGKTLLIPIHRELEDFLLSHPCGENATDSVFPTLAGRQTGGSNGVSVQFGAFMDSLGIPRTVKKLDAEGNETEALKSFHSLRHYFVSSMANANVSQELRKKLTGHSSDEMNDIYTTIETDTLRDAVDSIKIK